MLDGLFCGERLAPRRFAELKERATWEAFKWDITDDGAEKLCDFPLLLTRPLWKTLSELAVSLAKEAELAEAELLERPILRTLLGIPSRLQRALRAATRSPALRYSRFDFHPTVEGDFAITEGNLDVAGGWNEAGGVTELFAEHVSGANCADDPARILAESLCRRIGANATVGIMHLTRYTDDHQVATFLARTFERQGFETMFFDPTQLRAARERAGALCGDKVQPLDAVFRFFPAEWSCRLERPREWFRAVARPGTLWMNPLSTVLPQSKRFPLCWPYLAASVPTWSRLTPETRQPILGRNADWVLKPALGHEGFQVGIGGVTSPSRMRALRWRARARPWGWVAQRNLRPASLLTPHGKRFPCIGVYVVDGRPAGLYGRLAVEPLINDDAQDVVVLVQS